MLIRCGLGYKYNPLIYYIGRTTLIKRRMNNHIKAESNSKFHVFLNLIGLDHFKFSILEICSPSPLSPLGMRGGQNRRARKKIFFLSIH